MANPPAVQPTGQFTAGPRPAVLDRAGFGHGAAGLHAVTIDPEHLREDLAESGLMACAARALALLRQFDFQPSVVSFDAAFTSGS
jgi:hypothetical protein